MYWLLFWGVVTAAALIFEFVTTDLVTVWFAAGGLVTLFVVALARNIPFVWQLVIFVGVSVGLLLCTRKICKKLLNTNEDKMNVDALIGSQFKIDEVTPQGYAYHKINGVSWRVYPLENETLQAGDTVEVCEVKGNKLVAKQIKDKK